MNLSDLTVVMDIPWADLKPIAMKTDFQASRMFVRTNFDY